MKVELNKDDLVRLVKGSDPSYSVMQDEDMISCGSYMGGFNDLWVWDGGALWDLTEDQLWALYQKCVNSWNK